MLAGFIGRSLHRGNRGASSDAEGEELWARVEEGSYGPERSLCRYVGARQVRGADSGCQNGEEAKVITPTNCCEGEGTSVGGRAGAEGPPSPGTLLLAFWMVLNMTTSMMLSIKKRAKLALLR